MKRGKGTAFFIILILLITLILPLTISKESSQESITKKIIEIIGKKLDYLTGKERAVQFSPTTIFSCQFINSLECSNTQPSIKQGTLDVLKSPGNLFVGNNALLGYTNNNFINKNKGTIKIKIKPESWTKDEEGQNVVFWTTSNKDIISIRRYSDMLWPYPDQKLVFIIGSWDEAGELPIEIYADIEDWFYGNSIIDKFHDITITWDDSNNNIEIYIDRTLKAISKNHFNMAYDSPFSKIYIGSADQIYPGVLDLNAYIDYFEIWDDITAPKVDECEGPENLYQNPFHIPLADPSIIKNNGIYYMYGTSILDNLIVNGVPVYKSENLVDWEYQGLAYDKNEDPNVWANGNFWGGDIIYYNNKFYMTYSADGIINSKIIHKICMAESDSPLGPFHNIKCPFLENSDFDSSQGDGEVECSLFIDEDKKPYLLVVEWPSGAWIMELSLDLIEVIGEPIRILKQYTQEWEGGCNEGPDIIKVDGLYYLMYSGNAANLKEYALGYATATNPMGPWTKSPDNPIIKGDFEKGIFGPGNGDFVVGLDDEEILYFYHTKLSHEIGWKREVNFDRLTFADGKISTNAPTRTPQKLDNTCVSIPEYCNNRVDDDSDGLIDCADVEDCPTGERCLIKPCRNSYCEGNKLIFYEEDCQSFCINEECPDCSCIMEEIFCGKNNFCNIDFCEKCAEDYANCNELTVDGCESHLTEDNNNCGGCGNQCGAYEQCILGECININPCKDKQDLDSCGENKYCCAGYCTQAPTCSEDCKQGGYLCINSEIECKNSLMGKSCSEDSLICTRDQCDNQGNCIHTLSDYYCIFEDKCYNIDSDECNCLGKINNENCSDQDSCTINDKCQNGVCIGEKIICGKNSKCYKGFCICEEDYVDCDNNISNGCEALRINGCPKCKEGETRDCLTNENCNGKQICENGKWQECKVNKVSCEALEKDFCFPEFSGKICESGIGYKQCDGCGAGFSRCITKEECCHGDTKICKLIGEKIGMQKCVRGAWQECIETEKEYLLDESTKKPYTNIKTIPKDVVKNKPIVVWAFITITPLSILIIITLLTIIMFQRNPNWMPAIKEALSELLSKIKTLILKIKIKILKLNHNI